MVFDNNQSEKLLRESPAHRLINRKILAFVFDHEQPIIEFSLGRRHELAR